MGIIGGILDAAVGWRARAGAESTLARPDSFLQSFFGGGMSKAGVAVNESTATSLSTVWACVRAISEDISKLPLKVYRRLDDEGREVVRNHPAYRLLNVQANGDLVTPLLFREFVAWSVLLWGNGFAEIERNRGGRPAALWPMDPSRTRIRRGDGGELEYVYRNEGGAEVVLPAGDVLHVRGPTKDGIVGHSVVSKARESLGAAMATDQFAARFWYNGARPSGALVHPAKLSDPAKANLRESVQAVYGGTENAGRPILLEEGMTWTPFAVPPEDAQFLETRSFSVDEVCRWFRVPPHKVFKLDRSTFTNIEHQSIEYVTDGLGAWMVRIEQEAGIKLLSQSERETHYLEHLTEALLRGDIKARYEAYGSARQWGWMSVNEIRRRENMNALPGNDGNQYLVPVNTTTPAKLEATDPPASPRSPADPAPSAADASRALSAAPDFALAIAGAFEPVIADSLGRVLRIEADRARRAAKGSGGVVKWADQYYADRAVEVRAAIFAAVEGVGRACRFTIAGDRFVPELVAALAQGHVQRSREQLAAAVAAGDVEVRLADWEKDRADRDAAEMRGVIAARVASEMGLRKEAT